MKKAAAILLLLSMLFLCSCNSRVRPTVTSLSDVPGKRIGVIENSISEDFAKNEYAGSEIVPYQSDGVMANDLAIGAIDCIVTDKILESEYKSKKGLKVIGDTAGKRDISLVCARERADLSSVLSSALESMRLDGTIDKILSGNLNGSGSVIPPDSTVYKNTLKIAVKLSGEPYAYYSDSILMGFEIDILREVCKRSGLGAEFSVMQGDNAVSYVIAGRADIAAGCLFESNASSSLVVYSVPYFTSTQVIITRK